VDVKTGKQEESLVNNERTVAEKTLRIPEHHLSQLTNKNYPKDDKILKRHHHDCFSVTLLVHRCFIHRDCWSTPACCQ